MPLANNPTGTHLGNMQTTRAHCMSRCPNKGPKHDIYAENPENNAAKRAPNPKKVKVT